MLTSKLKTALTQLESIRHIVENGRRAREHITPYGLESFAPSFEKVDITYGRTFDYCATVTRAYATFERFVLEAFEQLIEWCFQNDRIKFFENKKVQETYEIGVAEILRRHGEARFAGVDKAELAHSLAALHGGAAPKKFLVSPFFSTLPNLNISHIEGLLTNLGFADTLSAWIADNQEFTEFLEGAGINVGDALKDLVERRNEAAHGNELPSNIWGANELNVRLELLIRVCKKFYEFVVYLIIKRTDFAAESAGLGVVTALWKTAGAFELKTNSKAVSRNTTVVLFKSGALFTDEISAIQIEGAGCGVYFGPNASKLGVTLKSGNLPKKRMVVLGASVVPGLDRLLEI
jgi:hypothetical protein